MDNNNDGKGRSVAKRPNENKNKPDPKRPARQPLERVQRLSKDERIGTVLSRLLLVASRFEAQLRSVGVTPDPWERTRDVAQRISDALNNKNGNFPNDDLSLLEEEHKRFVEPSELRSLTVSNKPAAQDPSRDDPTVGSSLTVGTEVLPSVAPMDGYFDFGNDDYGFDPGVR